MDRGTNQVTTRILAFSDLHGNPLPTVRRGEVDLVLIAGDLVPHGDATRESQWLRRYFIPWANRLAPTDIVLVGGNRDHYLSLPQQWPTNVYYLQDSEITLQGLRIYGMPWIERMEGRRPSMFELAPDELQGAYKRIPDGIDILIATCHRSVLKRIWTMIRCDANTSEAPRSTMSSNESSRSSSFVGMCMTATIGHIRLARQPW